MPTYGYCCPNGHEFEAVHRMGAPPPTACQVCGAAPVRRVFYPISTSFTGTGFYSTDYGQGEQKPEPTTPAATAARSHTAGVALAESATAQNGGSCCRVTDWERTVTTSPPGAPRPQKRD